MLFKKLHNGISNRVGYILMGSGNRFIKLTINTLKELNTAVAHVATADSVGCIVLMGHPGESFAVGADIGQRVKFWGLRRLVSRCWSGWLGRLSEGTIRCL